MLRGSIESKNKRTGLMNLMIICDLMQLGRWYGYLVFKICCYHQLPPFPAWIMPTITPKRPRALPKISTIRILTKVDGVWASASAQPAPTTPTQIPQNRFERPTDKPAPKIANPEYRPYKLQNLIS